MTVARSMSGVSPKSIRRPSSTLPMNFEFTNESEAANADLLSNYVVSRQSGDLLETFENMGKE